MHFKTIKRDEILPMIDQAKDKKEQKKILCQLLECDKGELDALIKELKAEKSAHYELCEEAPDETPVVDDKELIKKIAEDDELAAISAYANELQAKLKEKEAKIAALEKALDASTAAEESLKNCRELLLKYDKKISVLSEALSKALAFIASLNGVIADALKV